MDPDPNLWVGLEHVLRSDEQYYSSDARSEYDGKEEKHRSGMGYSYLVSSMSHLVLSLKPPGKQPWSITRHTVVGSKIICVCI